MLSRDFSKAKKETKAEKKRRERKRGGGSGIKGKRKMAEQDTLRRFMACETDRRKGTQLFSYQSVNKRPLVSQRRMFHFFSAFDPVLTHNKNT